MGTRLSIDNYGECSVSPPPLTAAEIEFSASHCIQAFESAVPAPFPFNAWSLELKVGTF